MMRFFIPVFISLASISHSQCPCEWQDPNCLPPLENDENLFPRCKKIYGNVEFLYWSVEEGALDYCIKQKHTTWSPSAAPFHYANGKLNSASYDWSPGVRVLLGFYNAPKYWEIFAQYTYLHACGKDRAHVPEEDGLFLNGTFPQLSHDVDDLCLDSASSRIDLKYQIADALFARVFDPNPHLRMRLIAGFTAAIIDQDWTVKYHDEDENTMTIKNDWCYRAGGLRLGVSADWWWKWCLYFTGKVSLAGFTGRYKNHAQETTDFQPDGFDVNAKAMDLTTKDYRYAQHLQLLLGPSWHIVSPCYNLELFAGYELNGWFNLHEVNRSNRGNICDAKQVWTNTGALALHGFTLRLTAGF